MSHEDLSKTNPIQWKRLAQCGKVADAIDAYVHVNGPTTFAALQRSFKPVIPVEGERSLRLSDPNVYVWVGLSDMLADAIKELIKDSRLFLHPTHWLVYLHDGGTLILPVVEELLLRRPYRSAHWYPVVLATYPLDSDAMPLARRRCSYGSSE